MNNFNNHVILNYVDSPLKILIWTRGEIVMFILPALIGLLGGKILMGSIVSFANYKLFKAYKRTFGQGQFQAVSYWFLPLMTKQLPAFPASYIREFRG